MKHIKELKLDEDFDPRKRNTGYEASTFANITTENIVQSLTMQLKDLGYDEYFFKKSSVKRSLNNYAKDMMNGFWSEIKDKDKLEKLSNMLERYADGPDHPFFPTGVFPEK